MFHRWFEVVNLWSNIQYQVGPNRLQAHHGESKGFDPLTRNKVGSPMALVTATAKHVDIRVPCVCLCACVWCDVVWLISLLDLSMVRNIYLTPWSEASVPFVRWWNKMHPCDRCRRFGYGWLASRVWIHRIVTMGPYGTSPSTKGPFLGMRKWQWLGSLKMKVDKYASPTLPWKNTNCYSESMNNFK